MDAIQFGRWLHDRRRKQGFSSQRALLERIQQDPTLAQQGFSEAFLARLEAGLLVHPFRGAVRQRVLGLAELLCRTARDVSTYLRAAELTELDAGESERIQRLRARLTLPASRRLLLLPPRTSRLFGRQESIAELVTGLRQMDSGLFLITGMPGVGKSALAAEVLHRVVCDEQGREASFPDGILSFSCRGYRGNAGLIALCEHLLNACGASGQHRQSSFAETDSQDECAVSRAINQVRLTLANRSLLILLDNLDAQFQLREVVDAFTGQPSRCVVLATCHYQFSPVMIARHLHLKPLSPASAREYLLSLFDRPLYEEERELIPRLCVAVGHLPLALESIAACAASVPLSLIYASLNEHMLASVLENEQELLTRLVQSFASLDPAKQQRFALLSLLDSTSVGLEWAAVLRAMPTMSHASMSDCAPADLAQTALELGYFVRHSLLDVFPDGEEPAQHTATTSPGVGGRMRYQLHPVLRAYGKQALQQMEPADVALAESNIGKYALMYIERHHQQIRPLLSERDLLYACFTRALQAGQHAEVVRFVDGLGPISCRLRSREEGTRLFRAGIQSCQQLHDRFQQARFMSSFGWLLCHRGAFADAYQTWTEALEMQRHAPHPYWQPLLNLAHAAHVQQDDEQAARYAEEYLHHAQDYATPLQIAYVHILLTLYKRLHGKRAASSFHLSTAIKHLAPYDGSMQADEAFVTMHLRLELARTEGNYADTCEPLEALLTLLKQEEEHYYYADILLDQATFAREQGQEQEVLAMAPRIVDAAERVDASYMRQRGLDLMVLSQNASRSHSLHPL